MFRLRSLVVALLAFFLGIASLHAGDLRIPLPKKSKYTPVQKLNREGVTAVERHQYDKAKKLFYEAYLIDPDDPFTLNNLGYMAELEGDFDRAQRFYALAGEQNSDAVIDKATNDQLEGKAVSAVAGNAGDIGMKANLLNLQAIDLLNRDRAPEADLVLEKALKIDPRNPFTLNNLGYAKEKEGEFESAYQYYTASANRHSPERVEIAIDRSWQGRGISEVAADNARKLDKRMRNQETLEDRVAVLNLRGVSAFNRNDRRAARDFIQQAYKLDPNDAFTLNNMGYLSEMDGDKETADYYYGRAQEADRKGARVTFATRKDAVGERIGDLADNTDQLVLGKMEAARAERERQGGPIELMHRDNTRVIEPQTAPPSERKTVVVSDENGILRLPPLPRDDSVTPSNTGGLAMPLPDNQQPPAAQGNANGGLPPLPDNQQPGNTQPSQPANPQPESPQPQAQPQGQNSGGLLMPLPDNQQPPEARGGITIQPANPQPATPTTPQPAPAQPQTTQPQSIQPQGQHNGGLLLPLPDNQQPPAAHNPAGHDQQPSAPPQRDQTSAPPQVNKISDFDQKQPQPKSATPGSKSVVHISDQD